MTWREFKEYIEEKYLESGSRQGIKLNSKIKQKFKSVNQEELETILDDLFLSIENYFEEDEEVLFHKLPDLIACFVGSGDMEEVGIDDCQFFDETSKQKNKTWSELFPKKACFGKINQSKVYSDAVWTTLGQIYTEWSEKEKKAEELTKQAKEWQNLAEKAMKEYIGGKIRKQAKVRGLGNLESQLKKWLDDYKELDEEEKKPLVSQKEEIEKIYELLKSAETTKSRTSQENNSNNWDWGTIFKYSLVGIVGILGISLILRLVKGK